MIIKVFIVLMGLCLTLGCSEKDSVPIPKIPNEQVIYLVYRGTHSKQGVIARGYNIYNTKVSHVGVLIRCQKRWKVYHVINTQGSSSALVAESLHRFLENDGSNLFHASLWKIKSVHATGQHSVCDYVAQLNRGLVRFDYSFSENDPRQLYCSEFVYQALRRADSSYGQINPRTVPLNPIHAQFLQKDSLCYYPVDLFQTIPQAQLLWSWTKTKT